MNSTNTFLRKWSLWGPLVSLLLWAVAAVYFGQDALFVRAGLYLAPWLIVLSASLSFLGAFLRNWAVSALSGALALGIVALHLPTVADLFDSGRQVQGVAKPMKHAAQIGVLTYSHRTGNSDLAKTAAILKGDLADIVALQEIDSGTLSMLGTLLSDMYEGRPPHVCHTRNGQVVLSRWPVVKAAGRKRWQYGFCEVHTPFGVIMVASEHLPRGILSITEQEQQVQLLWKALESLGPEPIILAGDFNTTTLGRPYRRLRRKLLNAFESAGRGFGFTFPTWVWLRGLPAVARIDHIFHSEHFVALDAQVIAESGGSDHYPVYAVLALRL